MVRKVATLLERFDYKPGHVLVVRRRGFMDTQVMLEALVPDAYRPEHKIRRVSLHNFPDPILDPDLVDDVDREFWRGMYALVHEFETHEMDEFFVVDGKRPYDPHEREGRR